MFKRAQDEAGFALITTLLAMLAVLMLVTVSLTYASMSTPISKHDQNWNGALAAANAGINDYLYRLNQNGNYWTYSATNLPSDGNTAFTTWTPVPGGSGTGSYRYAADTSTIAVDGTVKLTSTGRVGNATRSIKVTLRRRSFIDYLYFTNYETKDPARYDTSQGDPYTPAQAQSLCAKYYYAGRDSQCVSIFFISQDTINGPLHSNDAIQLCGSPHFNGATSTSYQPASGSRYVACGGGASPVFANAGDPRYAAPLTMPPTDLSIKTLTDSSSGGTGCLYTGPTKITFNSGGTMDVVSPLTKSTNTGCSPGTGLSLPSNGVVYVQNVPATSTDPNYSACPPATSPLGYPVSGDITPYGWCDGDVFISGTLSGQLTIASEHNINVIGDTTYAGGTGGTDLLGLIANNYVQVYHPVNSSCQNLSGRIVDPDIYAAILSLQHSFIVPNYQCGNSVGTLTVVGAIAQNYRGPVGTFNGSGQIVSGYAKSYTYDQRLKYLSPPHFLDPVQSAWQVVTWGEIPPAYAYNAP
ncbi:MAG TPA: hypothetical protein VGH10_12690 [Actinomycetota bacterium]